MSVLGTVGSAAIRGLAKLGVNAHVVTENVAGLSVRKNLLTGTQFLKLADGTKSITLSKGNGLSKVLGVGTSILSYPKGSMLNNSERLIFLHGTNGKFSPAFTPREFGDFVKMLKELHKIYA